jgi:hypothetical protein
MSLLGVLGFSERGFKFGISDTKLNFGPILRPNPFHSFKDWLQRDLFMPVFFPTSQKVSQYKQKV